MKVVANYRGSTDKQAYFQIAQQVGQRSIGEM